jgi:hypothetical protein
VWRHLADSVIGTSHERSGTPCQDSHRVTNYRVENDYYLIVVCSDGAGTAAYADVGAIAACEVAVDQVSAFLDTNKSLQAADRSIAMIWLKAVRDRLIAEAETRSVEVRQLACTLLLAVVGADQSLFAQIGDGAIVTLDSATEYAKVQPVFWPQNGEYANTTYFVTDARFDELALFEHRPSSSDGVAVFTDGIQILAIDYASKSAHGPFFEPFLRQLRETSEPWSLDIPFRQFLNSKSVNERIDDDKTLVIAVKELDCAI